MTTNNITALKEEELDSVQGGLLVAAGIAGLLVTQISCIVALFCHKELK